MKKLYLIAFASILMCFSCTKKETDSEVVAMRGLVNRVVPEYSKHIVLERLTDVDNDCFEIETVGKNLVIRGNDANSMAVGLNHYLKYYCKAQYSWFETEKLEVPAKMPKVETKVRLNARVPDRFFLNYCTFGYTMPWWGWSQWEHFIDWMALNGINLPLAITGQESVWYEVWRDFGLTDEEIRSYFTGPAHLPWHRMQNIDRWGGPLPIVWLENQKALQKQIVARERELNMKPVLPGFAGHVPPVIKRLYPDAPLASLGDWAGFDSTCWCKFLDPLYPLYTEIQKKFIAKQTEFYGTDHIYGIDIFNELIPPSWEPEYLARVSRQVYESLEAADPEARWLEMAWLFWNDQTMVEVMHRLRSANARLLTKIIGTNDAFSYLLTISSSDSNGNLIPMDLTLVNAAYQPNYNAIFIYPSMLLSPVMPREGTSEACSYAVFTIIGHEFTHGFDSSGAKYDKYGVPNNWWTVSDKMNFEDRSQNLIRTYNSQELDPKRRSEEHTLNSSHQWKSRMPSSA